MTNFQEKGPELNESLLEKDDEIEVLEKEEEITEEKIIKQLFPELVSRDERRKTLIDKSKLDTTFLVISQQNMTF